MAIAVLSAVAYLETGGSSAPLVVQLTWGTFFLLAAVYATAHPSTGPAKLKLGVARVVIFLGGCAMLGLGGYYVLTSGLLVLPGMLALAGGLVLYGVFVRIPWTTIEERLVRFRTTGASDVEIVPDETWYTVRSVAAGWGVMAVSAILGYMFRAESVGDFLIVGGLFLAGALLTLGSPLSGPVERTVRLYQALFVVVGGGFVLGGLYPFTTGAEPVLSMVYTFIGGVILIRGWLVDWGTVRAVVEEYRAVDPPSAVGFRELKRRVEDRREPTE